MNTAQLFSAARPVAIIGMGVMGTKVAWACARAGLPVQAFDVDAAKLEASIALALSWSEGDERERVHRLLVGRRTLEQAVEGVQLVFENVPEVDEIKRDVIQRIDALVPAHLPIGSNTSSMRASEIAAHSSQPQRVFAMNFSDPRTDRLVELMGHPQSDPAVLTLAEAWARHLHMVPVRTHKEQMGYAMNRLWRVIKREALRQVAEGITTPADLDRAWMLVFGMPIGPFGIMDEVGLETILHIEERYARAGTDPTDHPPQFLLDMVAAGHTGSRAGGGFYQHPEPAYRRVGFLERGESGGNASGGSPT
jgi:3-hydroxybutyryl-CoA dehydrogenase